MEKENAQYLKMTVTPIRKLIVALGIPTTISMLVTAIYNLADTFFVSQIGVSASGAVGVVFSFMAIIQAIGFMLGMGAGSYISSLLGQKENEEAQKVASSTLFFGLAIGVLIMIFGNIFIEQLIELLGATETVKPYAIDYARYIIYNSPIMIGSFILNNILRAEGKAKFAMIGITTGGILNIGLDPLFITTFNLGISGAAIATIISQAISFILLLMIFLMKKTITTLNPKYIIFRWPVYAEVMKVGMPSLFRQGLASISTILLNTQAGNYGGDPALSAMSIIGKVMMIVFSITLGIGQGYQPVCGYNYFAKKYDRVKQAMMFTFYCSLAVMTLSAVILYFNTENVFKLFFLSNKDEGVDQVIEIGSTALRYQCYVMPLLGVNVMCNMTYQSLRIKGKAVLLSTFRQGLFYIPIIIFLPRLIGLQGVELAQTVADVITLIVSVFFFISIIRMFNRLSKNEGEVSEL